MIEKKLKVEKKLKRKSNDCFMIEKKLILVMSALSFIVSFKNFFHYFRTINLGMFSQKF